MRRLQEQVIIAFVVVVVVPSATALLPLGGGGGSSSSTTRQHEEWSSSLNDSSGVKSSLSSSDYTTSRRSVFAATISSAVVAVTGGGVAARAEDDTPIILLEKKKSIASCSIKSGSNSNCVSTASVRNLDLYSPPWKYDTAAMSLAEARARLKGAIEADSSLSISEKDSGDNFIKVKATRGFAVDELEFVLNSDEGVITFRSEQTEGPEVSDFGANRKRLNDIRKRAAVFRVMGEEFESADAAPREGVLGQLKAFYGIQSGEGFEDTLLD